MTADRPWPGDPGVPMHPERDGWHWVVAADPTVSTEAAPWWWDASKQHWLPPCDVAGGASLRPSRVQWSYLGQCLTPTKVAAQVAAQVEAAGLAMREACVPAAWRGVQEYQQSEDHLLLQQIGLAVQAHIEALPLPTPALDALLAEARREGMREALSQAQSYEPVSFSSDGIEIPGALIGARSAKRVIVEAISATLDDAVAEKGAGS